MSTPYVVGVDVGSTYVKAVLVEPGGAEVATARLPTPWRGVAPGRTEVAARTLFDTVTGVLTDLLGQGEHGGPVVAIGVSGMAEAGALLDAADRACGPVIAWFDQRGGEQIALLPADLHEEFPGRTGLPLRPLATFAKLWHRRQSEGLDLAGLQWLSVPELVVRWLGGERHAEPSLVARTGLVDQDTGAVWPRAVEVLEAPATLVPPVLRAGSPWGVASRGVPPEMTGAVLTVAGHDHLVAASASGVLDVDTLYDSMGTAEALVRVLDGVLDPAARARLAARGINVVSHLLPGRGVMLAGTKSGLLMRRALQLVGVHDRAGRAVLDDQVMLLPAGDLGGAAGSGITVSGATNDDGVLTIRADADGLSPALLFEASLRHGSDVLVEVLAAMDAENPPATRSVLAGGWSQMRSVRRARQSILPGMRFSDRDEDTAFGAALVAAYAADPDADDLAAYLARRTGSTTGPPPHAPTSPRTHPTPEGSIR
jgi:sugar (pentulose or hexulose) kinase